MLVVYLLHILAYLGCEVIHVFQLTDKVTSAHLATIGHPRCNTSLLVIQVVDRSLNTLICFAIYRICHIHY
jgi:hypothetical protein